MKTSALPNLNFNNIYCEGIQLKEFQRYRKISIKQNYHICHTSAFCFICFFVLFGLVSVAVLKH